MLYAWHHVTQQQLDPSASYTKKLAQHSLYGHYDRGDKETKEDVVGESEEEEKERVTEQETEQESRDLTRVLDRLLLVGES